MSHPPQQGAATISVHLPTGSCNNLSPHFPQGAVTIHPSYHKEMPHLCPCVVPPPTPGSCHLRVCVCPPREWPLSPMRELPPSPVLQGNATILPPSTPKSLWQVTAIPAPCHLPPGWVSPSKITHQPRAEPPSLPFTLLNSLEQPKPSCHEATSPH